MMPIKHPQHSIHRNLCMYMILSYPCLLTLKSNTKISKIRAANVYSIRIPTRNKQLLTQRSVLSFRSNHRFLSNYDEAAVKNVEKNNSNYKGGTNPLHVTGAFVRTEALYIFTKERQ